MCFVLATTYSVEAIVSSQLVLHIACGLFNMVHYFELRYEQCAIAGKQEQTNLITATIFLYYATPSVL